MSPDDERHGTYAGAQAHRKQNEPPCGPCRAAATEYMRAFRSTPLGRRRTREFTTASNRAIWRLVDLHRDEYDAIRAEELAAVVDAHQ